MSWDVSIHKFSKIHRNIEEIPQDEIPLSLGARSSVHDRVLAQFPETDWSAPEWGIWSGPDGSIEFNLGKDDPPTSLMLHVRANSNVVPAIVRLCIQNDWQGIDCSSGEFIEQGSDPSKSLEAWAAYRDQIVYGSDGDA